MDDSLPAARKYRSLPKDPLNLDQPRLVDELVLFELQIAPLRKGRTLVLPHRMTRLVPISTTYGINDKLNDSRLLAPVYFWIAICESHNRGLWAPNQKNKMSLLGSFS